MITSRNQPTLMSNKRIKVLITGRLPKIPTEESKQQFMKLAATFDKNITVIYPTMFNEPTATWNESIRSDISNLMSCDELHLMHSWQGHKRSEILRNIALAIGIKPHYH